MAESITGVLIGAYLIVEFALCNGGDTNEKPSLKARNALTHAAFGYLLLQEWAKWWVPLFILIVHLIIGSVPWLRRKTARSYVAYQSAHVLSLMLLGWICHRFAGINEFSGVWYKPIIILAGFIATVRGIAGYIERFVAPLIMEFEKDDSSRFDGLRNGGKLIGELERSLIFLLVFIDQPMGIGFLVAAKSILRFEEAKNQKLAEYVLIGTLLSFLLAIVMAMLTKWAMNH